jgi:hypothetical protein
MQTRLLARSPTKKEKEYGRFLKVSFARERLKKGLAVAMAICSVEISDSAVITCSSELCKWSTNLFTNPNPVYTTYVLTGLSPS